MGRFAKLWGAIATIAPVVIVTIGNYTGNEISASSVDEWIAAVSVALNPFFVYQLRNEE